MDKKRVLSMLLDLEKELDFKLNKASEIGIDLDQFMKGMKISPIVEEIAEAELPLLPEMMQTWMRTGEDKDQLIDSILNQKNL